ncbi:MAG: glycosyltransferase family 9 protein [Candidatus Kapaibacterium sp.]
MKILVIRFSSAGDILLTSLFLRALRRRFPQAQIDFLTKKQFEELVQHSPHINQSIAFPSPSKFADLIKLRGELRETRYDLVFDLHNSLRSRIVRFRLGSRRLVFRKPTFKKWLLVRFKVNLLRPITPIPERYLDVGKSYSLENDGKGLEFFPGKTDFTLPLDLPKPLIALAPGARHFTKRWPAKEYAKLGATLLEERGGTLLLLGGDDEVDIGKEVEAAIGDGKSVLNLVGTTTLSEVAKVVERCSILVANDSLLSHVAAAVGTPVITIFGSTVEEFGFAPYGAAATILQRSDLDCRPCTTVGRSECPRKHFHCMNLIQVSDIGGAIAEKLD